MKMHKMNGREMEIEPARIVLHEGDTTALKVEELRAKLKSIFHNEFGNKVVRISYQRGKSTFSFDAGFEENMYNEVTDYVERVVEKDGGYPFIFDIHNFLSFPDLESVDSDTED